MEVVRKKKILIFIDWFLPGYKAGGPVRSMANMVEHLAGEYDFYIVTRNTDYLSTEPYTNVEYDKWVDFQSGVKVFYASVISQNRNAFKHIIREGDFDFAYVNGIYSWKFSILPLLMLKKSGIEKVIVASRGMLAVSAINVKSDKKRIFLKIAKIAGLYSGVVFHATNKKEAKDIKEAIGKNTEVVIAQNLPRKEMIAYLNLEKIKGELRIVSLARIAPEKNTLFALDRLSEFTNEKVKIICDIYGEIYNDDYWTECKDTIDKLPENIRVNYKGTVGAELVSETIQKYHVMFMPTRGENFGHVILESLSAGRPVLISDQTPWQTLESKKAGWVLPLYDNESWINKIEELCTMNQEEFNLWCKGARKAAEEFVNDPELIEGYRRIFN